MLLSKKKIDNIEQLFVVPYRPTLSNLNINLDKDELKILDKKINVETSNIQSTERKSMENKNIMKSSFPSYEFKSNINDMNINYSIDDLYNHSIFYPQKNEILIQNPEEVIQSGCLKGSTIQNLPEIDENNEIINNDINNNEMDNNFNINNNHNKMRSSIYDDLNTDIIMQNPVQSNMQMHSQINSAPQMEDMNMNNQIVEMNDNHENINVSNLIPGKMTETININQDMVANDVEKPNIEENNMEPIEEVQVQTTQNKKYPIISAANSVVVVPPNYSTDDIDEFNAIQSLNEDLTSWKKYVDKDNMQIYFKPFTVKDEKGKDAESVIGRLTATLDFPASKVIQTIDDFKIRASFDGQYEKGKLISEKMIEGNTKIMEVYLYMKMPFIFSDRDFVVQRKTWLDYNGNKDHALFHVHSIENPQYPEKDKPVRGTYINRSGYVKPLGDNQCKIDVCTCMDVKMSLGVSTMSKSGAEKQEKWVKGLKKACSN